MRTYENSPRREESVFSQPPVEWHYRVDAVFRADSGNWFSFTERRELDPSTEYAG